MEGYSRAGKERRIKQRHGHQLRSRFGPNFKRHVRMSDEDRSLKLDVKFPSDDDWQTITGTLARELQEKEREGQENRLRERLSQSDSDVSIVHQTVNFRTSNPRGRITSLSGANTEDLGSGTTSNLGMAGSPGREWRPQSTSNF